MWSCKRCGDCCKGVDVGVVPTRLRGDMRSLMEVHGIPIDREFTVRILHTCQHLKDDGCNIYDNRPAVCIRFTCEGKDEAA